jgi:hypothetical protein
VYKHTSIQSFENLTFDFFLNAHVVLHSGSVIIHINQKPYVEIKTLKHITPLQRSIDAWIVSDICLNQKKLSEMTHHFSSFLFALSCETRSKRSVEVFKGRNLHPLRPQTVTDIVTITCHRS